MKVKNHKRSRTIWILFIQIIIFLFTAPVFSQLTLCNYENCMNNCIGGEPHFFQQLVSDELDVREIILDIPEEVMDGEVYTVPVVFHILHKGEAIGTGSNISNSQIMQALSDLNDEFSNANGTGYDVGIQFCLAQQDPDGNSSYENGENVTGIQRVDANSIPNFVTYGMWPGVNEVQAKALSNWPEDDYLNIWVAHRLYTGDSDAAGFAYFPAAGDEVDGIALRADATGTSGHSKVITHEAGHYLTLHHTFKRGDSDCPIHDWYDCENQGDMICQTRPHTTFDTFPFPCDESLYIACDPNYNEPYLVTENHMNYTANDCRDEFVPEQAMRMRAALLTLRSSLLSSVGCYEGCTDVVSSFSILQEIVPVETAVQFKNTSINSDSFRWFLEGVEYSTDVDWNFTFYEGGLYKICLDAIGESGCINRYCDFIHVIPSCLSNDDPCERVQNGDFEQISLSDQVNNFENVCGWEKIQSSPYFCDLPDNNAIGLWFSDTTDNERITSFDPLNLYLGETCTISFDYLVTKTSPEKIIIALASNNSPTGSHSAPLEQNATIIAEINHPDIDYFSQSNNRCYNEGYSFQHYQGSFVVTDLDNQYITITGVGSADGSSIVFIDNVSINCCESTPCHPIPDFTYDIDCPKEFSGVNYGDTNPQGDVYTWNFLCENITMTGQRVKVDLPPGDCQVCLTIACDKEYSKTICKTVTIPEPSPDCQDQCIDTEVIAYTCEQDTISGNNYIAQVRLKVPDSTGACNDSDILMGSSVYDITLTSLDITDDPTDTIYDIITLIIEINTPPGVNLLDSTIVGFANFCDTIGNIICYNLIFNGTQCDNCFGDISATAVCVDEDPFDGIYQYEGSVTIDLPSDDNYVTYHECDFVSTEIGYTQVANIDSNTVTIDFTINTSTVGDFDATTLLCFFSEKQALQICYTLNIDVVSCPPLPSDCVSAWSYKWVNCKKVESGKDNMITYNFSMPYGMIGASGYRICDFGVKGAITNEYDNPIEGASVSVNDGYLQDYYFVFDVDFSVPCEYQWGSVILRLYFCNRKGEIVCYYFPLRLKGCGVDCDRGSSELEVRAGAAVDSGDLEVMIFPNPATNAITVQVKSQEIRQRKVVMLDRLGRVLKEKKMENIVEIDINEINPGLHFVKIIDETGSIIDFEKLIIIK